MPQAPTELSLLRVPTSSCEQSLRNTGLVIPTYNAGSCWTALRSALNRQGLAGHQILVVDSTSTDGTDELAEEAGYQVIRIPKASFGHGSTRHMATNHMPWAETIVFMTQDAIPFGDDAILNLVSVFNDPKIGAAYGRQLPRPEADLIEAHARFYNYPSRSNRRDYASRDEFGFRAAFFSNSFAAYRRSALEQVGGFPDVIVSEDVSVVAQMLIRGWSLAYVAEAQVVHSHSLSLRAEFSRYFDIAVHHSRSKWILEEFGHVRGEGSMFVLSELRFLLDRAPHLIPFAALRNATKWLGYHLGRREGHLPVWMKRQLSGQRGYWKDLEKSEMVDGRSTPVEG